MEMEGDVLEKCIIMFITLFGNVIEFVEYVILILSYIFSQI